MVEVVVGEGEGCRGVDGGRVAWEGDKVDVSGGDEDFWRQETEVVVKGRGGAVLVEDGVGSEADAGEVDGSRGRGGGRRRRGGGEDGLMDGGVGVNVFETGGKGVDERGLADADVSKEEKAQRGGRRSGVNSHGG